MENCTSAHVRLILRDDRRLTAEIKTTPYGHLSRSFHLFLPHSCLSVSFLLSLTPFFTWWSVSPLPSLPFSRLLSCNSAEHPCSATLAVRSQWGVFSKVINHLNQSSATDKVMCHRIIHTVGGKLRSNTPALCVCVFLSSFKAAEPHQPELDNFHSV